ncbi:MAG: hypothetical protein UR61_C0028G0001, partial [candidate division WS6 bacterium GW2011_GWE1_34_7]
EENEQNNVLGVEDTELGDAFDGVEKKTFLDTILEILTKIDIFIIDRISWFLSIFKLEL